MWIKIGSSTWRFARLTLACQIKAVQSVSNVQRLARLTSGTHLACSRSLLPSGTVRSSWITCSLYFCQDVLRTLLKARLSICYMKSQNTSAFRAGESCLGRVGGTIASALLLSAERCDSIDSGQLLAARVSHRCP
eukprot:2290989-Amphidinium_carterae.1